MWGINVSKRVGHHSFEFRGKAPQNGVVKELAVQYPVRGERR